MNTIVKSSNGITLVPSESRLLSERIVFIKGEITSASACEFAKSIMLLVKESSDKPIDIYLNTPCGDVNAGLLILIVQLTKLFVPICRSDFRLNLIFYSCRSRKYELPSGKHLDNIR